MLASVLIADKRKELPAKYKKYIEDEQTSVVIAHGVKEALGVIQMTEPDMILISDSLEENLADFCGKIRALTCNMRPIIIGLSKSADTNDRINVLESGADDFLSEPVRAEEFRTRIKAHLRRDIESNLDDKTLLPSGKIIKRALKRVLNSENKYAVLLLGIENFDGYTSVYSDVAGDKLVQTLAAITKSALDAEDFFGRLDDTNFVIITKRSSAEKLAVFLTFAFDTVAPKFYSSRDAKRGYMLLKGDKKAGMRLNFVSILLGGILENYDLIRTPDEFLEKLYLIKKTAKIPAGSNYAIERAKISGKNSVILENINRSIYISEKDEALSLLLRTALELQGYDIAENPDFECAEQPFLMIIDGGENFEGLELCRDIKRRVNFVNTKIIVTASVHNKSAVLDAGADLYIPKPYQIGDLIKWAEYFKHS